MSALLGGSITASAMSAALANSTVKKVILALGTGQN
jgi:hypothetical protein